MMSEPDYYDAKIAGWWVWGLSAWIGSGWCDAEQYERNKNKRPNLAQGGGRGVSRQVPYIKDGGRGVHRHSLTRNGQARPNLRPAQGVHGVPQQIPALSGRPGRGIGDQERVGDIAAYMLALSERLRRVRVACGDWQRILGPSPTYKIGMTAVFLDPPYNADAGRNAGLYATDSMTVSTAVRQWCLEEIDDGAGFIGPRYLHPKLRIALCGYEDEHGDHMPPDWECVAWSTNGGYANQRKAGDNENRHEERIWFSPNCIRIDADYSGLPLFAR